VEGGPGLLGSLFDAGLVDKIVTFISPKVLGGQTAPGAVEGRGAETPDDAVMLERVHTEAVGDDLMISGYVVRSVVGSGQSASGQSLSQ
jgi:diaminohydroxyphosphoribosylaminopyrimidine deaminase/5-amino-6-(5-phosphoribosylamino)uracil reductase